MSIARAMIFDLDDTLYAERDYAFSGFDAVAKAFEHKLGPAGVPAAQMKALFDTPDRSRVFNVVIAECRLPASEKMVNEMVAVYRSHTPMIALYPDADAALARLRPQCKLGLITDGFAPGQHAKIDVLALRERLDALIVTDDWGREFWKPHPRAFHEMSRRLKVPHEACTYVADNLAKDFIVPNALGWHTIFIKRPAAVHADHRPPEGGAPKQTITTLDALLPTPG